MPTDPVRFPFFRLSRGASIRPLLWVCLENSHRTGFAGVFPALVDTGADATLAPRRFCERLGHVFSAGTDPNTAGGVGDGRKPTFKHVSRLTVLAPSLPNRPFCVGGALFPPVELALTFMDQPLPFILLGQADFLRRHVYAQDCDEGWFSLQRKMGGA
jgi:hypothetical protein